MSFTMARLEIRSSRYFRASVRLEKYLVPRVPPEISEGDAEVPGIQGATGITDPELVAPELVLDPVPVVGALHLLS